MKQPLPTFSTAWTDCPMDQLNRFYKGGAAPKPMAPPPPVTERRTEVMTAKRQTARDARKRMGQMASLYAGETGGGMGYQRSLLGG
jgi:hypothetical protein